MAAITGLNLPQSVGPGANIPLGTDAYSGLGSGGSSALATGVVGAAGQLESIGNTAVNTAGLNSQNVLANAQTLSSLGQTMFGQDQGNQAYATQALQNAFDPFGAQQAQGLASTMDVTNAQLANSGLAGTPYGASVAGGAAQNFANNWQTQQIQRESTGASTAATLQNANTASESAGGQLINDAGQLNQSVVQDMLQAYGLDEQSVAAAGGLLSGLFGQVSQNANSGGGGGGGGGNNSSSLGSSLGSEASWAASFGGY